jgi:cystathionine beta-synthase
MEYAKSVLELIGNTPLVQISDNSSRPGPLILAKLEFVNPGGSVKDRLCKYVIEKALQTGRLKPGDTIIDSTSGNTGIGIALIALAYGMRVILTAPDKVSKEKIDLMRAMGADVIITPTEASWDDPRSCLQTARRLAREKGYFYFNQYDNPDNIMAHYLSTGPEIWKQTDGRITCLMGGIGTGGTVSGAGKYLKEQNPKIKVVAVDPPGSLYAEYIRNGRTCPTSTYLVEGIGSDMVTKALDPTVIDEVMTITDEDSFTAARRLIKHFGILAGGSSGTAAFAAFKLAGTMTPDDIIVVIFPDSAYRYLSKCFSDQWMIDHGFKTVELNHV